MEKSKVGLKLRQQKLARGLVPAAAVPNPIVVAKLQQAISLHQQSQLVQAEALYQEILQMEPNDFDALHLSGVIALQRGNAGSAFDLIGRAIQVNPDQSTAHSNLGNALRDLKRPKDALASYDRALQLQPDYANAHGNRGNALRDLKRPEDALLSYERALKLNPGFVEVFNNRGNALRDLKRYEEALVSYDKALQIRPAYLDALNNRGKVLRDLKRYEEALGSYERAIQIKPDEVEALRNRGNVLHDLKRYDEALASYERVLQIKTGDTDALNNRGNVLSDLKRHSEALASYDAALHVKPDCAVAFNNRGNVFQVLGRHEEALASIERALQIDPDYIEALSNRGNVLHAFGRDDEALLSYGRALQLNSDDVDVLSNRGNVLVDLNRNEEALADFDRALQLEPDHAEAMSNRGNALINLNRAEEALACYDQAIRIRPDYIEAHNNRTNALRCLNRFPEALDSCERALQLQPDSVEAHWNESLCRLVLGDFELGWQQYEWRRQKEEQKKTRRIFKQPLWLGIEPLHGKTILLHAEQGFGDTIQFCRYAKLVAAQGATVLLEAPAALAALLTGVEGVSRVISDNKPLPEFDFHCPLLSLPLAFKTRLESIPAAPSYLAADPVCSAKWKAKLGDNPLPKIGLVWSGRQGQGNDLNRTIPFANFIKLTSDRAQFVSLQKEVREADKLILDTRKDIVHFGDELADFGETAGLISNMDLIISVDTSVGHLACALGKPVWLLLPFNPDWRWLLDRSDSPWYPSARLFRQTEIGDWDSVILVVAQELNHSI